MQVSGIETASVHAWSGFHRVRAVGLSLAAAIACAPIAVLGADVRDDLEVDRRERCERNEVHRLVELRSAVGGVLPCEVVYRKPDEDGSSSVLWKASVDPGYCVAQFDAFIAKLETKLDWSCQTALESTTLRSTSASADVSTRLNRLLALVPPGTYAVDPAGPSTGSRNTYCPSEGAFSWRTTNPERPSLIFGGGIEATVLLPDGEIDDTTVLGVISAAGEGATMELQSMAPSPMSSDDSRRAFDLKVAPRGPGSGALSPSICRYRLTG